MVAPSLRPFAASALAVALMAPALAAQGKPTIEQFMSPASPLDLVAAKKADRVAWMAYDRGMRNVYTARAPDLARCPPDEFPEGQRHRRHRRRGLRRRWRRRLRARLGA